MGLYGHRLALSRSISASGTAGVRLARHGGSRGAGLRAARDALGEVGGNGPWV